jgi:hypothetical protein
VANRPFWIFEAGKFKASVAQAKLGLEAAEVKLKAAVARSLGLLAEDWLSTAQARAHVRSGALRGSADVLDPVIVGTEISVEFGFNIRYGRFRNFGGTIKPVKAKMLAIPLKPVLTGRGVARYSSPREQRDLFVIRLAGKLFLARKRWKRKPKGVPAWQNIELDWKLVPSVTQQGDKFLTSVIEERRDQAPALLAELVRKELGSV